MKNKTRRLYISSYGLLALLLIDSAVAHAAFAKNVLFIAIDDLRPALGCYNDPTAISPNIDRIAERGMRFNRAYCQQAVGSPSRLSLLSGRRPDSIRVWDLNTHFRQALPNLITLPQHFKKHGYTTRSTRMTRVKCTISLRIRSSSDPWKTCPKYSLNSWKTMKVTEQ